MQKYASCTQFPEFKVLGCRIHAISIPEVITQIGNWIEGGKQGKRIVVTGFHGIWEAHQNSRLKEIVNSADLWIPDGIAPVWVARLRGLPNVRRTPGAELMAAFFAAAQAKAYKSFFYGDTQDTLLQLQLRLQQKYPQHRIVGAYSPPFRKLTIEEDRRVVDMINSAKPDVLWVALGMPKQDRWIYEHIDKLQVPVAIGVGAAFGFLSAKVKRAPAWIGDIGFEWAWRLLMEPRKLWRRDLCAGTRFLWHVALELCGLKKYD